MKVRDSGMPDEEMWSGFLAPNQILKVFGLDQGIHDLIEFGCGYGTFALAAARMVSGTVHALDIEPEMVAAVVEKCDAAGLTNVQATLRDFVAGDWPARPWTRPCCSTSSITRNPWH